MFSYRNFIDPLLTGRRSPSVPNKLIFPMLNKSVEHSRTRLKERSDYSPLTKRTKKLRFPIKSAPRLNVCGTSKGVLTMPSTLGFLLHSELLQFKKNVEQKYDAVFCKLDRRTNGFIDKFDLYMFVEGIQSKLKCLALGNAVRNNENFQGMHKSELIFSIFDIRKINIIDKEDFLSACSAFEYFTRKKTLNIFDPAHIESLKQALTRARNVFVYFTATAEIKRNHVASICSRNCIRNTDEAINQIFVQNSVTFRKFLRYLPFFMYVYNEKKA